MKWLLVLVFAVGCSSSEPKAVARDDLYSTGVSCSETARICCSGDVGDAPVCVDGKWHCPKELPEFIPSAQCNLSRTMVDTGTLADEGTSEAGDTSSPGDASGDR